MQRVEESEEFGCLGDAVLSLKTVPREYLERDHRILQGSDDHDNATLNYGPDARGFLFQIEHQRHLHWFSHKCRAIASRAHKDEIANLKKVDDEAAVHAWLARLGVDELMPLFIHEDWCSEDRLRTMQIRGLSDAELDVLGVDLERHRAALKPKPEKKAPSPPCSNNKKHNTSRSNQPQTATRESNAVCMDCGKGFGSRHALVQHCSTSGHCGYTMGFTHGCGDCALVFGTQQALNDHAMSTGHNDGIAVTWQCFDVDCSKCFVSQSALEQHCNDTGHWDSSANASLAVGVGKELLGGLIRAVSGAQSEQ